MASCLVLLACPDGQYLHACTNSSLLDVHLQDQLRLGRRVHSLKLDGSPHVQHMRFDKAVYLHAISQWVQLVSTALP